MYTYVYIYIHKVIKGIKTQLISSLLLFVHLVISPRCTQVQCPLRSVGCDADP